MLERDDQELPLGPDPETRGADPVMAKDEADSK
jgi:hypothetical protein